MWEPARAAPESEAGSESTDATDMTGWYARHPRLEDRREPAPLSVPVLPSPPLSTLLASDALSPLPPPATPLPSEALPPPPRTGTRPSTPCPERPPPLALEDGSLAAVALPAATPPVEERGVALVPFLSDAGVASRGGARAARSGLGLRALRVLAGSVFALRVRTRLPGGWTSARWRRSETLRRLSKLSGRLSRKSMRPFWTVACGGLSERVRVAGCSG